MLSPPRLTDSRPFTKCNRTVPAPVPLCQLVLPILHLFSFTPSCSDKAACEQHDLLSYAQPSFLVPPSKLFSFIFCLLSPQLPPQKKNTSQIQKKKEKKRRKTTFFFSLFLAIRDFSIKQSPIKKPCGSFPRFCLLFLTLRC